MYKVQPNISFHSFFWFNINAIRLASETIMKKMFWFQVVSDINSDYSFVSAAILYIEDIKNRGKSTQIYSHVNLKILTLFRKLQSILCTFQNLMGLNRADITSYISRSEFNLPTGDVADLVESDYLALIQIGNLMTDLINKYS